MSEFVTGDLITHEVDADCPCLPHVVPIERDDGTIGWIVVHHAWDGRQ